MAHYVIQLNGSLLFHSTAATSQFILYSLYAHTESSPKIIIIKNVKVFLPLIFGLNSFRVLRHIAHSTAYDIHLIILHTTHLREVAEFEMSDAECSMSTKSFCTKINCVNSLKTSRGDYWHKKYLQKNFVFAFQYSIYCNKKKLKNCWQS